MIISTVGICEKYSVVDTIFLLDQYTPKGFLGSGGFDMEASFEKTKIKLEEIARSKGGDAVIGCNFEIRMATNPLGSGQIFEIFCFGTVVKIID